MLLVCVGLYATSSTAAGSDGSRNQSGDPAPLGVVSRPSSRTTARRDGFHARHCGASRRTRSDHWRTLIVAGDGVRADDRAERTGERARRAPQRSECGRPQQGSPNMKATRQCSTRALNRRGPVGNTRHSKEAEQIVPVRLTGPGHLGQVVPATQVQGGRTPPSPLGDRAPPARLAGRGCHDLLDSERLRRQVQSPRDDVWRRRVRAPPRRLARPGAALPARPRAAHAGCAESATPARGDVPRREDDPSPETIGLRLTAARLSHDPRPLLRRHRPPTLLADMRG
jgi:hypothetical protein